MLLAEGDRRVRGRSRGPVFGGRFGAWCAVPARVVGPGLAGLLTLCAALPAQTKVPGGTKQEESEGEGALHALDRLEDHSRLVGSTLEALSSLLCSDSAADFQPEALAPLFTRQPAGPPSAREEEGHWQRGTLDILRNRCPAPQPHPSPSALLGDLLGPWSLLTERRMELKLVGLSPLTDGAAEGDAFEARVLVHGLGHSPEGLVQWNAHWHLRGRSDSSRGNWRIESLAMPSEEWIRTPRPLFREATRAVLEKAGGRAQLLGWGAETWLSRVDHVGEPQQFGHNGLALGDVNGDDLLDLYVATGTGTPNLLFLQRPDGTLEERGAEAGVAWLDDTKGVLLLDFDCDGKRDLLAAIGPAIVLCLGDGKGGFTPAQAIQAHSPAPFYALAAADYDLDGDLDVYALRYVESTYGRSIPRPFQDATNGPSNRLLRNDGISGFVDVTSEVGLDAHNSRFSLSATWVDYDDDGDSDLYVANDFGRNNLYRNQDGHFVDVAAELGVEDQAAGMGVSWADIDHDGDLDLHVSNMYSSAGMRVSYQKEFRSGMDPEQRLGARRLAQGNSLFLNDGGSFQDVSAEAGIRMGRWAWGARLCELNGDGYPDVIVPAGFVSASPDDDL